MLASFGASMASAERCLVQRLGFGSSNPADLAFRHFFGHQFAYCPHGYDLCHPSLQVWFD